MIFELNTCPSAALAFWQALGVAAALQSGVGDSFFLMLLKTLLVLCFVCGLAYLIFGWVLPRLSVARSASSMVRIVDVVGLDARKRLYVIEVAGRWLLVASSEAGVQLVSELDAATAEEAAQAIERARPTWQSMMSKGSAARENFAELLARMLDRRK